MPLMRVATVSAVSSRSCRMISRSGEAARRPQAAQNSLSALRRPCPSTSANSASRRRRPFSRISALPLRLCSPMRRLVRKRSVIRSTAFMSTPAPKRERKGCCGSRSTRWRE